MPYRSKTFDYALDYGALDLREHPELYRVGRGEQGVLLVEPYKSEILRHWRFRDVAAATKSAAAILGLFAAYKTREDFVGMDMARKFVTDGQKAAAAAVFQAAWKQAEADTDYQRRKAEHKERYG